MRRETGAIGRPSRIFSVSSPAGAMSLSVAGNIDLSNASRLVRLARVSLLPTPAGRRKSSNFAIAPAVFAKSLACNTCVVDCQPAPSTWRATKRHAAVLPTPDGPAISKWGGFALQATFVNWVTISAGKASSANRLGACETNQLVMLSVLVDSQRFINDGVHLVCIKYLVTFVSRFGKYTAPTDTASKSWPIWRRMFNFSANNAFVWNGCS